MTEAFVFEKPSLKKSDQLHPQNRVLARNE